ncbi:MxaK protein [uncultured Methylibium sp.]|uniref:MxaK protein n=1 Tax=uncultured Methylibium sp. TaxID=381093 RepID=UPI0025F4D8B8|nr:MxaK protein [uncultured Methylibium sp.]
MRRITVHAVFGVLAVACAAAVAVQVWRLQQATRLNAAIAEAAQAPVDPAAATLPSPDAPPAARLARAVALARAGAHDAAAKTYVGLIRAGDVDAIGRDALFNLGNLYLRQGQAQGGEALPLVELAKQRYRDLLRASPGDWDARYNLERALRLAPEEQEAVAEEVNEPVERRRVMLRGMDPGDLP